MKRHRSVSPHALAAVVVFVGAGCASVSSTEGHDAVDRLVRARTGQPTRWADGSPADRDVEAWLDELLRGGLTPERAVAIALFDNPELQETYEELGVSQADMVQAGLLKNPSIGGHVDFAASGTDHELEGSLVQDFLDLFVLPARKRIAREQFEADVLRVAQRALDTAAEVTKEVAWVAAATRLVELRGAVVDGTGAAATLADAQLDAGNITELADANERVLAEESALDLAREELELVRHRERLNRLLGLAGARADWKLARGLPAPDGREAAAPPARLEETALARRLDVDAARKQALLMQRAVDLARSSRFFGRVEVGVEAHQFPSGPRVFGPTLVLELPIFDQRQALIARLEAQRREAARHLAAVSLTVRAEVRVAHAEVAAAADAARRYDDAVLPLRARIVAESQLQYNGMLVGAYQLLRAKQDQIEAQARAIAATRDYWIARADLARALGGSLTDREAQP
jgi:outer membrane protein, heavy metal efflux system